MTLNINVETKNVIKIFALAAAFTVGIFAILTMKSAIMLILVAFFLALALNPAVGFIAQHLPGKRRGPAIAIVMILAVSIFLVLVASIVSPVVRETSGFAKTLPDTINDLRYRNEKVRSFINKYELDDNIDTVVSSSKQRIGQLGSSAISGVGTVTNSVIRTISVIVLAVLMLSGGSDLVQRVADKTYRDKNLRRRHEQLANRMYRVVTGYANGQVIVALIASLFAVSVLSLLRVPYPIPLAAIVFIFGLIPLIGNTIAAILVVLLTVVFKSLPAGLIMLAYFILYQQIENATLQPVVQGKTTQLPPLVIFMSVILGVALLGPIGGLFAIPAAGCARILFQDYLDHRDDLTAGDNPGTLFNKVKNKLSKAVAK